MSDFSASDEQKWVKNKIHQVRMRVYLSATRIFQSRDLGSPQYT